MPYRRKRRKIKTGKRNQPVALARNEVWSCDFIFDRCTNGRTLKCFNVLDEGTRMCLTIDVDHSIRTNRVIAVLQELISTHGCPKYLRCDNGPEFIAKAIRKWLSEAQIQSAYIEPGKPWQNPFVESFHSRFRDECLNTELFNNLFEARVIIGKWKDEYNTYRPHSSLGYKTPQEIDACMRDNLSLDSGGN